jgi:hypothetical protein
VEGRDAGFAIGLIGSVVGGTIILSRPGVDGVGVGVHRVPLPVVNFNIFLFSGVLG